MKRLLLTIVAALIACVALVAQVDHKRGHLTVRGELQVHYRQQPLVDKPTPLFWVNDVYFSVPPGSDLEKFFLAKAGTRVVVKVEPE